MEESKSIKKNGEVASINYVSTTQSVEFNLKE